MNNRVASVLASLALFFSVSVIAAQSSAVDEAAERGHEEQTAQQARELIAEQQRGHVRESYGEEASQCLTSLDLQRLVATGEPRRIALRLEKTPRFTEMVENLARIPSDRRKRILTGLRRPLRPTWRQLGRITRTGQTEAGARAEAMIADAIVDLVEERIAALGADSNGPG
jgi:hypothetical protein